MLSGRVRLGVGAAVLACALTLAGGTVAGAHWFESQQLPAPTVATGDLEVTTTWVGGAPTWGPLLPGESAEATLRVEAAVTGTTAGARLHLTGSAAPAAASHLSFDFSLGDCSTPSRPGFPESGYPSTGYLQGAETVDVCVKVTLDASAPNSLQGTDLAPVVEATLQQSSGA